MNSNIEYEFHDGENTTSVDRKTDTIMMYERGGWSRSYTLTFAELLKNAKKWDVKIDLNDPDAVIAEIATNIMLANNASEHGLDPFRFIPRTNKITDPKDRNTLKSFEALLDKYGIETVISALTQDKQDALKKLKLTLT